MFIEFVLYVRHLLQNPKAAQSLANGERVRVWARDKRYSRQKALCTDRPRRWMESRAKLGKMAGPDPARPYEEKATDEEGLGG